MLVKENREQDIDNLRALPLKEACRQWWERHPMGYGVGDIDLSDESNPEVFREIDHRLRKAAWFSQGPDQRIFSFLIDYEQLKGKRVLEIGCGMGTVAEELARSGADVTAIDISERAVRMTRGRFRLFGLQGNIIRTDSENLPFADNTFDYVWSWGVIHHSPNVARSISEIHRVVRPGGRVGVMVYHKNSLLHYIHVVLFRHPLDGYIAQRFTHEEFRNMFSEFGRVRVSVFGQRSELWPKIHKLFKNEPHLTDTLTRWMLSRVGALLFVDVVKKKSPDTVKVALMTEIISPYRIPILNRLADNDRIQLDVFFLSETEHRRSWRVPTEGIRFPYRVLPGLIVGYGYQMGPLYLNPGIIRVLKEGDYDAVICGGYHHPTVWVTTEYCRRRRKRLLLWSESTLRDDRPRIFLKEWMKRKLVSRFDSFIAAGTAQVDYLKTLGGDERRMWIAPDTVDISFFERASRISKDERARMKAERGLHGPAVLYVGRMVDEKGLPDLFKAFPAIYSRTGAELILVGDGPEEKKYRNFCKRKRLHHIHFEGFRHQEELVKYYAMADVFVFPTRSDAWGLVLNEAMAAGLPLVCSRVAGAVDHLVRDGENGFLHEPGNTKQIAEQITMLVNDADLRRKMGARSSEIIQHFTPARMAQGFVEAVLELPNEALIP